MRSSMSSVIVLCPNGRRVTVKTGPNSPLLQVLEQTCAKQQLDPDQYVLKRESAKVFLDLSCPFRFSGLTNNAKLELVKTDRPRSSGQKDVQLMVQTEDGQRVQDAFPLTTSLWSVLEHFQLIIPDPAIIYMRQQIIGEHDLKTTSLKDLGLSQGRVAIRLVSLPSSREHLMEECPTEEHPTEVHPTEEHPTEVHPTEVHPTEEHPTEVHPTEVHPTEEHPIEEHHNSSVHKHSDQVVEVIQKKLSSSHTIDCSSTSKDDNTSTPMFPALPFSIFPNNEPETVHEPELAPERKSEVMSEPMDLERDLREVMKQYIQPVTTRQSSVQKIYEEPCDRDPIIYHLDAVATTPTEDVDDDFFKVTVSDVLMMQQDLKRQTNMLSNVPLVTAAMKETGDKGKWSVYHQTIIRVIFPNRWVLQGCFNSGESLKSLVLFVREHLAQPSLKFHLYTAPPKEILKSGRPTFAETGFVPAALIHFSPDEGQNSDGSFLSDVSMTNYHSTALQAEINASQRRSHKSPLPSSTNMSLEEPSLTIEQQLPRQQQARQQQQQSQNNSGQKLPKWLKLGQK